jgi:hypothetical protein
MVLKYFSPHSSSNWFRAQRFRLFKEIVDEVLAKKDSCRVLDIGGTHEYWDSFGEEIDFRRVQVSLLNLTVPKMNSPKLIAFAGDARNISQFEDFSFDVVHSNSVIEHVGRWADMVSMAKEVRRLAKRHFVQTPYFWFPVEPHARFPLLHWMPESWRYRIIMKRKCGFWQKQDNVGDATSAIQSSLLLDKKQFQFLFPDSKIVSERAFGLTKSLIAIR